MIRGTVRADGSPVVPLVLRAPDGSTLDVDALVDTGFTASLTLPPALVKGLGLIRHSKSKLLLADGTLRRFGVYVCEVFWDGQWRPVLASAIGDEVLVGMRMLDGYRVLLEAVPGGAVEIAPLL